MQEWNPSRCNSFPTHCHLGPHPLPCLAALSTIRGVGICPSFLGFCFRDDTDEVPAAITCWNKIFLVSLYLVEVLTGTDKWIARVCVPQSVNLLSDIGSFMCLLMRAIDWLLVLTSSPVLFYGVRCLEASKISDDGLQACTAWGDVVHYFNFISFLCKTINYWPPISSVLLRHWQVLRLFVSTKLWTPTANERFLGEDAICELFWW